MTFWNKFWIDWNFCTYSFTKRSIKLRRLKLLTIDYFLTKIIWKSKIYGAGSASEEKYFVTQNWDILECRIRGRGASLASTLTLFVTELLCHYAMCKESSCTKNEYNLFLSGIRCSILFHSTILSKITVFSEKTVKNCFVSHLIV